MGCIYGLRCPKIGNFRYIGMTTGKINRRLTRHLRESRLAKKKYTHKENWIRSLDREGLADMIEIIEIEKVDISEMPEREIYWISHYRKVVDLTNSSEGGKGITGIRGSAHHAFGKPLSAERKLKLSIDRMGEKNPMYGKTYTRTAEMRDATSRGLRNSSRFQAKKADPEYRAKIKATLSKPVYLVTLDNVIHKEYSSCRDIAKEFGVTYSTVKNARRFGAVFSREYRIIYVKDYTNEQVQVPANETLLLV